MFFPSFGSSNTGLGSSIPVSVHRIQDWVHQYQFRFIGQIFKYSVLVCVFCFPQFRFIEYRTGFINPSFGSSDTGLGSSIPVSVHRIQDWVHLYQFWFIGSKRTLPTHLYSNFLYIMLQHPSIRPPSVPRTQRERGKRGDAAATKIGRPRRDREGKRETQTTRVAREHGPSQRR